MAGIDFDLRPFFWFLLFVGALVGSCTTCGARYIAKHVHIEVK